MLVLSRQLNENIVIDGRIYVKVVRVDGGMVKLGIQAPADVPVHRQEVYDEIQRNNQAALNKGERVVPRISNLSLSAPPTTAQDGAETKPPSTK